MDAYLSIDCSIPSTLEDDLPTLLSGMPVLGTEIRGSAPGRVEVTVYMAATERDRVAEVTRLISDAGGSALTVSNLEAEDWMARYRDTVRPFAVGSTWWVDPHPSSPTPAPAGRRRLVVPPGMAFGSGSHESTMLLLQALESCGVRGRTVLDVGTGSGILALAVPLVGGAAGLHVDIHSGSAPHTSRPGGRRHARHLGPQGRRRLTAIGRPGWFGMHRQPGHIIATQPPAQFVKRRHSPPGCPACGIPTGRSRIRGAPCRHHRSRLPGST